MGLGLIPLHPLIEAEWPLPLFCDYSAVTYFDTKAQIHQEFTKIMV